MTKNKKSKKRVFKKEIPSRSPPRWGVPPPAVVRGGNITTQKVYKNRTVVLDKCPAQRKILKNSKILKKNLRGGGKIFGTSIRVKKNNVKKK